jgi:hypothetical protein
LAKVLPVFSLLFLLLQLLQLFVLRVVGCLVDILQFKVFKLFCSCRHRRQNDRLLFQPRLIFAVKPGEALLPNLLILRRGWKDLPRTNTLIFGNFVKDAAGSNMKPGNPY